MKELRGKYALVTGAASGIGRAIALALAREGAHLSLWDVHEANLTQVVDHVRNLGALAEPLVCDLAKPAQITQGIGKVLSNWNRVDVLVNNAGVAWYGPTDRMTADHWNWLLQINLHAPIQLTRELLPTMLQQGEAHVLNTCSIAGLVGSTRITAYNVSKFGLVGFTESMRREYARRGIGFTALCPGLVQTSLFENTVNGRGDGKPVKTPPRWLCSTPEKVARKAIKSIKRNRGLVLVSPMAHLLWLFKRLSPRLLDWATTAGKKTKQKPQSLKVETIQPLPIEKKSA